MKKIKFLFVLVFALFLVALTACDHDHEYTNWTIDVEPTETSPGKATGVCDCEEKLTTVIEIPKLTDTSIWTLGEVVKATCDTEGKKTYSSDYGSITIKVAKLGHKYSNWTMTKAPTAQEAGKAERTCSVCNNVEKVDVPVLTNTTVWTVTEVKGTCTKEGTKTYSSVYGSVNVTTTKGDHVFGDWSIINAPTTDQQGKAVRTCVCGEKEEVTLAPLSDASVWTVATVPSTCSKAGVTKYTSVYGTVTVNLEKLPHTFVEYELTVNPTETKAGKALATCICGEKVTVDVAPLTDEIWTCIEIPSTCTKEGTKTYYSVYGKIEIALSKVAHEFGSWNVTVVPTETAAGKATRKCYCGESEEKVVPMLTDASVWTVTTTPATCTAAGIRVYTSEYGTYAVSIPQNDHNYGAWTITIAPDLVTGGFAERVCECGDKEYASVPVLTDSTWTKETVQATCKAKGIDTYTSEYGVVKVELEKLDHTFGEYSVTKAPTLTEDGKAERVCTACGEKEEIVIAKLSNTAKWRVSEVLATCEAEGSKTYTSVDGVFGPYVIATSKLAHNFSKWVMTVKPTTTEVGKAERVCECGIKEYKDVAKLTDATVWKAETVSGTCDTTGTVTYTSIGLDDFGSIVVSTSKIDHSFGQYVVTTKPTETLIGVMERTCELCGKVEKAVCPVLTDTTVWNVVVVQPTCHTEGTKTYTAKETAGFTCEVVVTIDALEHIFGDWELVTSPTLVAEGTYEKTCSLCNDKEQVTVAKLTDELVWTVTNEVLPSCTTAGSKTYESIYGTVVVPVSALGHSNSSWVMTLKPTMNATGTAERTCSVCHEIENVVLPVLTDTTVWTVSQATATCQIAGTITYTSEYGVVNITVDKAPHPFNAWNITLEPTTTEVGSATRVCPVCGETETAILALLTDTTVWQKATVEATCTKKGSETYVSVYGTVVKELEMIEHSYAEWVITVEPTKTVMGKAERTCSVCEKIESVDIAALSDTNVWSSVENSPTCTTEGSIVYSSIYGDVVVVLEKAPHNYGAWTITKAPTKTEIGSAKKVCECGEEKEISLPVLTATNIWTYVDRTEPTLTNIGGYNYTSIYGTVSDPIPVLSDTTVWNRNIIVQNTYTNAGEEIYTSDVYGDVTVITPNLVAPYDNKTYKSFALDAEESGTYVNGVIPVETAWSNATVSLNENGSGFGAAFPFRGQSVLEIIDDATGKVKYILNKADLSDPENPVADPTTFDLYNAYVDKDSSIIVRSYWTLMNYVIIMIPTSADITSDIAKASAWDDAMAIEYYADENTTYRIFIYKERVYFGVNFFDQNGDEIIANECYNAAYVCVKQGENEIVTFVHNGTKLVKADGYQGTYTNGTESIVISGCGTLEYLGKNGTYSFVTEKPYTAEVYSDNTYYELTLNKETKVFTINKPMVTLSYETGTYADAFDEEVNINIAYDLPKPTNETNVFKGWFYDELFANPVVLPFTPTVSDTLYAKWAPKVVVNIVGVTGDDPSVVELGEGDKIGDALPNYTIDLVNNKLFKGWYFEDTFENTVPEEAEVTVDDSGVTIYAKWVDIPVYYGEYKGTEVYGVASTSGTKTISIDENGTISGQYSGIVTAYDETEHKITWKTSASSPDLLYFYYNHEAGILAFNYYKHADLENDYYIYTKNATANPVSANYAVNVIKTAGGTVRGYYARFLTMQTINGVQNVFVHFNNFYPNVVYKDSLGNDLEVSTIKNSKTICVYDKVTGELYFAGASISTSFNAKSDCDPLDAYFGTYTNGTEEIILSGTGEIVYGLKTGTYTFATSNFNVYLENNTEYYVLTLNGSTFEMVKPVVTIDFVTGDDHDAISSMEYNINVVATLPDGLDEGYVFNGWFFDDAFTSAVPTSFIPTENDTLYAKYSLPAVVSIHYNNTTEDTEVVYSIGDITNIPAPSYAKHVFDGWFTTPTFDEGTSWTSGNVITTDVDIYAKWSVAPVYNNYYMPTEIAGTSTNGSTSSLYTRTSAGIDVDPYGKAAKSGYPFGYGTGNEIRDYDPLTGKLNLYSGTNRYQGFIDLQSGIIIINSSSTTGADKDFSAVYLLTPFERGNLYSSSISSSYWNSGKTRAIEYTYDGTTYSIFVFNNNVYFGVSFKNAEGTKVVGANCYVTNTLYVTDKNNNLIAKFGYDGTTMQFLDGNEGTYTNNTDTLVVDGIDGIELNDVNGTYVRAEATETYTIGVYVNNEYLEITLDKDAMTYSVVKPMVTVSFDTNDLVVVPDVNTNKNINITLSEPTVLGYVFRGWYLEDTYTTKVSLDYKPTSDLTLFGKFDPEYTFTVIYGNGMDPAVVTLGAGDVTNPVKPAYTNGQVFDNWYKEDTFTNIYTPGAITANTTIYCKWKDPVVQFGSYVGFEVWKSGTGVLSGGGSLKSLTIDAYGKGTGFKTGVITDYDSTTGHFNYVVGSSKYYGYYNETTGVIAISYYTNPLSLSYDIYLFVKNATSISATGSNLTGSVPHVFLMDCVVDGNNVAMFMYDEIICYNVSYSSTDGPITASTAFSANQVKILDANGDYIISYARDTSGKLVQEVD